MPSPIHTRMSDARPSDDVDAISTILVRDSTPADAEEVANIFVASARKAYEPFFPPNATDPYSPEVQIPRWTTHLAALPPSHQLKVALLNDKIAGFVEVGPRDQATIDLAPHGDKVGEVYYIFVNPGAEGKGVGKVLMAAAERILREDLAMEKAVVHVFVDNESARKFYERIGWKSLGVERAEPIFLDMGKEVNSVWYEKNFG